MEENTQWLQTLKDRPEIARDFCHANDYELVPYLVEDGRKHPVAILCPGGGYGMVCSYVEGEPFARQLNRMGIHALVVYYRVREKARFPAPQDDLARAVREAHDRAEEWNLDMRNYSVWGSSAGGHLAASFGTETMGYAKYGLPQPGAMVLIYPVVTMGPLTHEGTRENLLGNHPTEEQIAMTSVEQQVTAAYPPTFLWTGDADQAVPPDNSRMLAAALKERNIHCRLEVYPGVDHGAGLGIGLACEGWLEQAVDFWQSLSA